MSSLHNKSIVDGFTVGHDNFYTKRHEPLDLVHCIHHFIFVTTWCFSRTEFIMSHCTTIDNCLKRSRSHKDSGNVFSIDRSETY